MLGVSVERIAHFAQFCLLGHTSDIQIKLWFCETH